MTGSRASQSSSRPEGPPSAGISRRRALWLGGGALGLAGVAGLSTALTGCGEGTADDAADPAEGAADGAADRSSRTTGPPPGDRDGAGGVAMAMFASPSCGCCGEHAEYLRANGYDVDLTRTDDLDARRADHAIPDEAVGCHFATVDGYVVEGHVPVEAIERLLRERPAVDGIALPGMPTGSPGMGGSKDGPFEIVSFDGDVVEPFMTI